MILQRIPEKRFRAAHQLAVFSPHSETEGAGRAAVELDVMRRGQRILMLLWRVIQAAVDAAVFCVQWVNRAARPDSAKTGRHGFLL